MRKGPGMTLHGVPDRGDVNTTVWNPARIGRFTCVYILRQFDLSTNRAALCMVSC